MRPLKQFGSPVIGCGRADALLPAQQHARWQPIPKGALNYWKSSFLTELSDAAIDTMIGCFARCPTPMGQLLLEHIHGAATRIGVGDTAFPHRDGRLQLPRARAVDGCRRTRAHALRWARETYARMQPFFAAGRYVNYLDDDEAGDPVAAAYGPNYRRLQRTQGQVRSEELLPHEPEHPAVSLTMGKLPCRSSTGQRAQRIWR